MEHQACSMIPADQEENMASFLIQLLKKSLLQSITATNHSIPSIILDYNDYVGRIGIGRVFRGTMKVGEQVALIKLDGRVKNSV